MTQSNKFKLAFVLSISFQILLLQAVPGCLKDSDCSGVSNLHCINQICVDKVQKTSKSNLITQDMLFQLGNYKTDCTDIFRSPPYIKLYSSDTKALIACSNHVYVLNISDPGKISTLFTLTTPESNSFWLAKDFDLQKLYVGVNNDTHLGIEVYDMTSLNFLYFNKCPFASNMDRTSKMIFLDDKTFIAEHDATVEIFELSGSSDTVQSIYQFSDNIGSFIVNSDFTRLIGVYSEEVSSLYVGKLVIFDISIRNAPVLMNSVQIDEVNDIQNFGLNFNSYLMSLVTFTNDSKALLTHDISDPSQIELKTIVPTPSDILSEYQSSYNLMFVKDYYLLDISNPSMAEFNNILPVACVDSKYNDVFKLFSCSSDSGIHQYYVPNDFQLKYIGLGLQSGTRQNSFFTYFSSGSIIFRLSSLQYASIDAFNAVKVPQYQKGTISDNSFDPNLDGNSFFDIEINYIGDNKFAYVFLTTTIKAGTVLNQHDVYVIYPDSPPQTYSLGTPKAVTSADIHFLNEYAIIASNPGGLRFVKMATGDYLIDENGATTFAITKNGQLGFGCCGISYDLSDMSKFKILNRLSTNSSWIGIQSELSYNEKFLYGLDIEGGFHITDISDPMNLRFMSRFVLPDKKIKKFHVSKNMKYAYFTSEAGLFSCDISDPSSPQLIGIMIEGNIYDSLLNSEANLIYMSIEFSNSNSEFGIYNITNPHQAIQVSSINYSQPERIKLSSDKEIISIKHRDGLSLLDISNPHTVTIIATDFNEDPFPQVQTFSKVTYDSYINQFDQIYSVRPLQYQSNSIFFDHQVVHLGEKLQVQAYLGSLLNNRFYLPDPDNFLLNKVKLSARSGSSSSSSKLPNWLVIDYDSVGMNLDPGSLADIGVYELKFNFARKLEYMDLRGVVFNKSTDDATVKGFINRELFRYVDYNGYLLSSFNPDSMQASDLVISSQYEDKLQVIYDLLKSKYIQVKGKIAVVSSLVVHAEDKLSIDTLSFSQITATLKLGDVRARFVNKLYASNAILNFRNDTLTIIGSLSEINRALQELVIDLDGINSVEGRLSINDGLNPITEFFDRNISRFFKINSAPQIKISIKSQLSRLTIQTGVLFLVQFEPQTFIDADNDNLIYTLTTTDGNSVPAWISLIGLSISGQPPMESGIKVRLRMTASDNYKSTSEDFVLEVSVSAAYVFGIIGQLVGPVVGALGAIVYANQIYNILCIKRYRNPKVFKVLPGQDITDHDIFPLVIAGEEKEEAELIWKELKKKYKKGIMVEFVQGTQINEEKLLKEIENLRWTVEKAQKNKFFLKDAMKNKLYGNYAYRYHKQLDSNIINQIVVDKLIFSLIEQEKPTKKVFDSIKEGWSHFVKVDSDTKDLSKIYKLDVDEYQKIIMSFGVNLQSILNFSPQHSERKVEEIKPLKSSKQSKAPAIEKKLDYELLRIAMEAFIRQKSQISSREEGITIEASKVLVKNGFVGKVINFARLNLKPFLFQNKDDLGYGIKFRIFDHKLVRFCGQPTASIKGLMLVFQVKNLGKRILREYVIEGVDPHESKIEPALVKKDTSKSNQILPIDVNILEEESEKINKSSS